MANIRFQPPNPKALISWFAGRYKLCKVTFLSLFYNDFISWSYVVDTLLEPAYWCIDTFAKALGPIFVAGVFVLTSSVVGIAYVIGLPYYWNNKGPHIAIPIVTFGQFFFVNVVFHYWKALTTHPGRVPTSPVSECLQVLNVSNSLGCFLANSSFISPPSKC